MCYLQANRQMVKGTGGILPAVSQWKKQLLFFRKLSAEIKKERTENRWEIHNQIPPVLKLFQDLLISENYTCLINRTN
jgi:hypothetical protein